MAWVLIAGLSVVCLALTYYFINVQRFNSLARANGCRPPRKYAHKDPVFGLDLFIQEGKMFGEHTFFPTTIQRYEQNGTTFETKSLGKQNICSCEPDNLQSVFAANTKNWGVSYRLPALKDYFGRGFLTTDGAEWEHSRALLAPSFTRANLSDPTDFNHYLELMMKQIPRDGSTIDLQALLFSLYLDTATLFLFGNSFDSLSNSGSGNAQSFIHSAAYSLGGGGLRMGLGPLMFLHRDAKWHESNRTVHRFIDKYVDEALARKKLGGKERLDGSGRQRPVLLDAMAEQSDDKMQLRNEALQAFIAAHETTACLISNIFYTLARYPSVWKKLREEVLTLGEVHLDFEVPMKLKYLRNVINETLRLYPVFPYHVRVAVADTTLPKGGGPDGQYPVYVKAGALFNASFIVLHRLPSIWGPDANEFNPDRWDSLKPKTWEFAPFGGGPRSCVGRQKALMETSYLVVKMLRVFKAVEPRDDREWVGQVQITAKNLNGCKIALVPA